MCDHLFDLDPTEWSLVIQKIVDGLFGAVRKNVQWSRSVSLVAAELYSRMKHEMSVSEANIFREALASSIDNIFMDVWQCAANPGRQPRFPQYTQQSDREAITTFAADVCAQEFINTAIYAGWTAAVARCRANLEPVKFTSIMLSRGISQTGRKFNNDDMMEIQTSINRHFIRTQTADNVFDDSMEERNFRSLMGALMDDAYKHPYSRYSGIKFNHIVDSTFPSCYEMLSLRELGIAEPLPSVTVLADSSFSDDE